MRANTGLRERFSLTAAFLLMGFSFSITQAVMARELLTSFAGNEMSIGLVLGAWLLLEAIGSGLVGRAIARRGMGAAGYALLQCLFALMLVPVLGAAYSVRQWWAGTPVQVLGLPATLVAAFLLLAPLGLVDGAMFAAACRVDSAYRQAARAAGRVYVAEAVGGIAGGLAFTFLFIPRLHASQTALILAALNLASALSLATLRPLHARHPLPRAKVLVPGLLLACTLVALLSPAGDALHRQFAAWQWRGYELAFYANSVYGNVAAIRQGQQFTFFANGAPILTSPVPDVALVEEIVHLPMLFVREPKKALVLNGGLGGVIHELLKYPLEQVDYAELDPLLIEAVRRRPTPLTEAELNDPRVRVAQVDGRLLVRQLAGMRNPPRYDLIVLNLPYPTTLQMNRFYTVEFLEMARQLLADGGVFVFPAPGSLSYLSPAMRDMHNGFQATLSAVFPHIRAIPDDVTYWLASSSEALESTVVETLTTRWRERGIPSQLMTEFHIQLKLSEQRRSWFAESLTQGETGVVNRDLQPAGLRQGLALWNEVFSPELTPVFRLLSRLSLRTLVLPLLAVLVAGVAAMWARPRRRAAAIPIAVAATGFGGMTADLLIIFAFQVYHGYVYHSIALLISAFMAGLSLGGWVATRTADSTRGSRQWFLAVEAALVVFWLGLPVALKTLYHARGLPATFVEPALFALNALAGFLVGAQFPLANRLYPGAHSDATRAAGMLYAADLAGAFAASLLVSGIFLPSFGIAQTCLFVAMLKVMSGVLAAAFLRGKENGA
ncbi:MAG: hypothetical protein QHH80_09535 [Anaerolineae bacterium]|nr:hypothetical protein [Anaerolineae bacterium]